MSASMQRTGQSPRCRQRLHHRLPVLVLFVVAALAVLFESPPAQAEDCGSVRVEWAHALCSWENQRFFYPELECVDCDPLLADIAFVTVVAHDPVVPTEQGGPEFETRVRVDSVVRSDGAPKLAGEVVPSRRHGTVGKRFALIVDPAGTRRLLRRDDDRVHIRTTSFTTSRFIELADLSPPCVFADIDVAEPPCESSLCSGGATPPATLLLILATWAYVRRSRSRARS